MLNAIIQIKIGNISYFCLTLYPNYISETNKRRYMAKTPLLGKTLDELKIIVQSLGMPKFTAGQIAGWLYDKKVASVDEMTNLSLKIESYSRNIMKWGLLLRFMKCVR